MAKAKVAEKVEVQKSEVQGSVNEPTAPVKLSPDAEHFVFKSKYKDDKVTLKKGRKEQLPDGSTYVEPPVLAEFSRYTWVTDDPVYAEILRDGIKKRLLHGNPIHILETTSIKE
jgi:hypothetical protein